MGRGIICCIIIILFICSCSPEEQMTKSELIGIEVSKKKKKYRERLMRQCYENTLNDAIAYVDSIVSEELSFADTLTIPAKPQKPMVPGEIKLNDSLRAKPIFKRR